MNLLMSDIPRNQFTILEIKHIVQIQRLGYKKIAGEIRGYHENALAKSFETSPHIRSDHLDR